MVQKLRPRVRLLYRLAFEDRPAQNKTFPGEILLRDGLTACITEDTGSEIVWIDKEK